MSTLVTPSADPLAPAALDLSLRVQARRQEADDILSFELVDPAGGPLPPFEPGSHVLVDCGAGVVRAYSLCNAPSQRQHYRIAVLRESASRGGSTAVHRWQTGRMVRLSSPRNHFALAPQSLCPEQGRVLLLAGGIGITPLLAMAEHLHALGRPFELHYCTRSAERTAFAAHLHAAPYARSVVIHHDDAGPDQMFDAERVIGRPADGDHLYACGPQGFLAHVMATARQQAWADAQLHQELFKSDAQPASACGDRPFDIEVANRGIVVTVQAGETALEALRRAGVDVLSACGEGICGTCLTPVLAGRPDHRDQFLMPEDQARNDCFAPCCSRALDARLVIEA